MLNLFQHPEINSGQVLIKSAGYETLKPLNQVQGQGDNKGLFTRSSTLILATVTIIVIFYLYGNSEALKECYKGPWKKVS